MYRGLVVIGLAFLSPLLSAGQVMNSGGLPVSLVELYTSEGCSSCPPADRFMSSLKDHPELFKRFVPMAFHVEYWNYLGWTDRFSDVAYSARQRLLAAQSSATRVYTPEMFIAGQEWRGILRGGRGFGDTVSGIRKPVGNLRVELEEAHFLVSFSGKQPEQLILNWAWLGAGLSTRIQAGENQGRTLNHDFVVLRWQERPLDELPVKVTYGDIPDLGQQDTALVVWITGSDSPAAIQVVADWVDH